VRLARRVIVAPIAIGSPGWRRSPRRAARPHERRRAAAAVDRVRVVERIADHDEAGASGPSASTKRRRRFRSWPITSTGVVGSEDGLRGGRSTATAPSTGTRRRSARTALGRETLQRAVSSAGGPTVIENVP
jgi:subtilisin family serine protease